MQAYPANTPLRVLSYAKINLFLRVIRRRPDGYHNLLSLMCAVELADEMTLNFRCQGIAVSCNHAEVPVDQRNTAWRAARFFFEKLGLEPRLHIQINKNIPVAAGLGGGSSNAATVLTALNRAYGTPLSHGQIMAAGRAIGADVPFFITGGPAWAAGIGDRLRPVRGLPAWNVVLVNPGFAVSTADTYKNLNLRLTKCQQKLKYYPLVLRGSAPAGFLCNDLESVTLARYTELADIKNYLLELGAVGALMSGSGPTVFGLFDSRQQASEIRMSLAQNKRWQVFLTQLRT